MKTWSVALLPVLLLWAGCREQPLAPAGTGEAPPSAEGIASRAAAPVTFPGRLQAEDYKAGEGIGYLDLTPGNAGWSYRADPVDIEPASDAGGGHNVGWIDAGEWLAYDVDVARTGLYTLTLRMASDVSGDKTAAVVVDGGEAGVFTLGEAGGWQAWHDVVVRDIPLAQGRRSLRIEMRTGGFNLNHLTAVLQDDPILPPQWKELEIMSFNVQQPWGTAWESRRDKAVALLSAEDPDIVGTQEAVADQRDYLLARLPRYGCFGVGRDGGEAGEGSWILYRKDRFTVDLAQSGNFWLSTTPDRPSRLGGSYNRLATHARLIEKGSGRIVHVFNVHFYMPGESPYRQQAARQLVAEMAKRARAGVHVIATGDFNSSEGDAVTRWLKSGADNPLPLRDTYRDFDPYGRVTTGFGTKLDYVYLEKVSGLKVTRAWVTTSPADASDHMPISATLAW